MVPHVHLFSQLMFPNIPVQSTVVFCIALPALMSARFGHSGCFVFCFVFFCILKCACPLSLTKYYRESFCCWTDVFFPSGVIRCCQHAGSVDLVSHIAVKTAGNQGFQKNGII